MIVVIVVVVIEKNSNKNACVKSRNNHCMCDGVEMPVLIDGDSVRLADKTFTETEIGHLKALNANNQDTTYSIFEALDKDTLNCAFTWGSMPTTVRGTTGY